MTDVEHPRQTVSPDAGQVAAQYPTQPGAVATAAPTGLGRFVPDAGELNRRLDGVADKPVRARKRPSAPEEAAGPSSFVPAAVRENLSLKRVLLVLLAAGLVTILLGLLLTGNLDFRGPQETSQTAPPTEPVATTPTEDSTSETQVPFADAIASGLLSGTGKSAYPAGTPKDAMTALISAVTYANQPLMASLLHPEARIPEIVQIVDAMDSSSANLATASQTVTCTESGETASCTAQSAGLPREVQFVKAGNVWQLTGWA